MTAYVVACVNFTKGERGGLMVYASDPDPETGVRAPLGSNRVVSLSMAHLLPKSTGYTQEAVAPFQHDWKIVNRDVKNQSTNQFHQIEAVWV